MKNKGTTTKLVNGVLATCPFPTMPALIFGMLGRRTDQAKTGLGGRLLTFAIVKAVEMSAHIGVAGIVLDALTDDLLGYYKKKAKFERLPYPESDKRRMLLTMADARLTIASV